VEASSAATRRTRIEPAVASGGSIPAALVSIAGDQESGVV
jgi:hypothetical protein